MPTLHKFKLLASQCAVAGSPTRSPTTSPVIHLRRRKTLRMFLARRSSHDPPQIPQNDVVRVRHKLKDLFVKSPPPPLKMKKTRPTDNNNNFNNKTRKWSSHGSAQGRRYGAVAPPLSDRCRRRSDTG